MCGWMGSRAMQVVNEAVPEGGKIGRRDGGDKTSRSRKSMVMYGKYVLARGKLVEIKGGSIRNNLNFYVM